MSRRYKRFYELTIVPAVGDARVIRDLRINFEITKSTLSFPNLCRLNLYNPSPDTLASLQGDSRLILNIGYEGDVRLLFQGDVRNLLQSRKGVDRVATVYAGDGEKDWQSATFNRTFSSSVTISEAIEEVVRSFKGSVVGTLDGLPSATAGLRGQTLSGSSRDILDAFATEYGFSWSIQDGEVVIVPWQKPLESDEAVVISAATGMTGTPTLTEIGVDVTCLIDTRLLPNRAFVIESLGTEVSIGNLYFREVKKTTAEGIYKVEEVTFRGDNREGEWLASVKGRSLNV